MPTSTDGPIAENQRVSVRKPITYKIQSPERQCLYILIFGVLAVSEGSHRLCAYFLTAMTALEESFAAIEMYYVRLQGRPQKRV